MILNLLIMWQLTVGLLECTVDVDLPEMKYLADHLKPEECRRLVAALHFKSYDKPSVLDEAEGKISEDLPCLNLLLHWNSAEGEGRGETHEILFRRLRQIGRDDLADWVSKTVFHELGADLHHALAEPFPNEDETDEEEDKTESCKLEKDEFSDEEIVKTKKPKIKIGEDVFSDDKTTAPKIKHKFSKNDDPFPEDIDDDFPVGKILSKHGRLQQKVFPEQDENEIKVDWLPIDTICWTIILLLVLLTVFIVYRAIKANRKDNKNGNKPRNSKNGKYQKMNQSDSEYDDPAMKLMGVKSES